MLNEIKKLAGKSNLKDEVIDYVLDNCSDEEDLVNFFEDLMQHGCQSGMVGTLIYYTDTVKFYNKHNREINGLLHDIMDETGYDSPNEIFGEKWDEEDPLAQEQLNQNLLAWFGFEESARKIAWELGLDI